MRSRIEILDDLISLRGNLQNLRNELSKYPWDCNETMLVVTKPDLKKILQRYLKGEFNNNDLEDWAETIECRDDLDFEKEEIKEIIHELANPILNGSLTERRIKEIIDNL